MAETAKKTAAKAATKTAAKKASAPAKSQTKPSQEQIARLAYTLWEESGREHGHADTYWLRAERELLGLGPQKPAR